MATSLLPAADQRVALTVVATGEQLTSLVDEVAEHGRGARVLLLREPVATTGSAVVPLPEGAAVEVDWTSPSGRHHLSTHLAGLTDGKVRLWVLEPEGATRTTQLRRFARAADALPATVSRGGQAWGAVVADLGEGGARCVVVDTQDLGCGDEVVLHVDVDGEPLALPAAVLEVVDLADHRSQLRLRFHEIGRAADVVRRRVLAQQRRARAVTR